MSIDHQPLTPDGVLFDNDNPEWTEAMFAQARRQADILPRRVRDAFAKSRGRPRLEAVKVAVKLRLDPDVVDGFKAGGPGWQTRINAALRAALASAER